LQKINHFLSKITAILKCDHVLVAFVVAAAFAVVSCAAAVEFVVAAEGLLDLDLAVPSQEPESKEELNFHFSYNNCLIVSGT
jgi:hypothetical protein